MTYVELIVVLSIFAVLSTVVLYNYSGFESKVDLKNLASDVALQIVQAQKSALSGLLPTQAYGAAWKPSYGVYFNKASSPDTYGADNKDFIYFVDINSTKTLDSVTESLGKSTLIKNNTISALKIVYADATPTVVLNDLTITFVRPDSSATLRSSTAFSQTNILYAEITVHPPKGNDAYIRLYLPGRIEID